MTPLRENLKGMDSLKGRLVETHAEQPHEGKEKLNGEHFGDTREIETDVLCPGVPVSLAVRTCLGTVIYV